MNILQSLKRHLPDPDAILLSRLVPDSLSSLKHAQGRSFLNHLKGTRQILQRWNQSPALQMAGLCHSLYSTDAFAAQAVPIAGRAKLRAAIGVKSEELVYLFCAVKRASLYRALVKQSSKDGSTVEVLGREELGPAVHLLSMEQAMELMVLHLANLAEQSAERDGKPSCWLENFAGLARLVKPCTADPLPQAFSAVQGITRTSEFDGLRLYKDALSSGMQIADRIFLMKQAAMQLPFVGEIDIWLASLLARSGDRDGATQASTTALQQLNRFGTSWDKRFSFEQWSDFARELKAGRLPASVADSLDSLLSPATPYAEASRSATVSPKGSRGLEAPPSRFEQYLLSSRSADGAKTRRAGFPGLRDDAFWNAADFQLTHSLGARAVEIRQEISCLDNRLFHDEAETISRTGSWKILLLLEAGRWVEEHCILLPHLSSLLQGSEDIRRAGGLIYLSRLAPHTQISAHAGPTNTRLRLHYALEVPEGDCVLRVGQELRKWQQGHCLVFNDHLEHEVWNNTDHERLVLLVDIWHPDLSVQERKLIEAIHALASEQSRGLLRYWRKNREARESGSGGHTAASLHVEDAAI